MPLDSSPIVSRPRRSHLVPRLNRRQVLGLSAGAAALLAACGSKKTAVQRPPAAGQGGTPVQGGRLALPVRTDPFDWDPSYAGNASPGKGEGVGWVFDSLLRFKAGPGVQYNELVLQPALAERWESPDAQTYVFQLRPGLKFADVPPVAGRALTAADVKWSYEYWSRSGPFKQLGNAQYASMFEGLSAVEAADTTTVTVRFAAPFAPFLANVGSQWTPVVPHEIYDQDGNFKSRVVGTGPWQLDAAASSKGSRWEFKRNGGYWEAGRPYIDQLTWLVLADDATTNAAFEAGQIDILTAADPNTAENIRKGRPNAVTHEYTTASPYHLYMNVRRPPLSDLRVRKAFAYSIDRDEFVKALTVGKGAWALAGGLPDTFSASEVRQLLRVDAASAKSLVAEAGYRDGVDLEIVAQAPLSDVTKAQIELLQAQLKRGDINLKLTAVDAVTATNRRKGGQFGIYLQPKLVTQDVDSYLSAVFIPGATGNYGGVDDPDLTKLLAAQRQEMDAAKRKEIVRQAVRRINVDQVWAQALYYRASTDFWQPNLRNYAPHSSSLGWPLTESWLAKK